MSEADLMAMILTLQTQVDQLADKVDTLEARLAGVMLEIEKLKRGSTPKITNADGRFLTLPIVPKVVG